MSELGVFQTVPRRRSVAVDVGGVVVGGGAPVVVQSMTNTDTADIDATVTQVAALFFRTTALRHRRAQHDHESLSAFDAVGPARAAARPLRVAAIARRGGASVHAGRWVLLTTDVDGPAFALSPYRAGKQAWI